MPLHAPIAPLFRGIDLPVDGFAAQQFTASPSTAGAPSCECTVMPSSNGSGISPACADAAFGVSYPTHMEVGAPFQITLTGTPAGGAFCSQIVQGEGQILGTSQNPLTVVALTPSGLCIRIKYTVNINGTECSTCQTICLAAELFCPTYGISLHCPTLADSCPVLVSANAINTVFAMVTPEGFNVYWEIHDDPDHLVEWKREYPTQLRFRTRNAPGTFTVWARYGPESGPCMAAYASCVVTIDPDTDGDGLSDSWENTHCTLPGNPDTDGDQVWDGVEIALGTDPCNPNSTPAMIDSDGDGLTDIDEMQVYHTDPHSFDTDGDGISDYAEVELKRLNIFPEMDPLHAYSLADANTNLEHVFDGWQSVYYLAWDKDRDGLFDPWELATGLDPTQADQDGDGIADGLEMRPRVMGVDSLSGSTTYAAARSPMFAEDGARGGGAPTDSDGDGLTDQQEDWLGTNSRSWDSDHDGVFDADEVMVGLDPNSNRSSGGGVADGDGDFDGDGLTNRQESSIASMIGNPDTDGDGTSDGQEHSQGSFVDDASDGGTTPSSSEWITFRVECLDDPSQYLPEGVWYRAPVLRVGRQVLMGQGTQRFRVRRGDNTPVLLVPTWFRVLYHNSTFLDYIETSMYQTSEVSGLVVLANPAPDAPHIEGWDASLSVLGDEATWNFSGNAANWEWEDDSMTFKSELAAPRFELMDAKGWDFSYHDSGQGEFTRDITKDRQTQEVQGAFADGASLLLVRAEGWPEKIEMNLKVQFENFAHVPFVASCNRPGSAVSLVKPVGSTGEFLKYQFRHDDIKLLDFDPVAGECETQAPPGYASACLSFVRGPGCFLYCPPDHFSDPSISPSLTPASGEPLETTVYFRLAVPSLDSSQGYIRWKMLPSNPNDPHAANCTPIILRRAPLLLVHGFSDNPAECWSHPHWQTLQRRDQVGRTDELVLVDYGETSYLGVDTNMPKLARAIRTTIEDARRPDGRSVKLACTRVDVVAHSMGGLITRWYMCSGSMTGNFERGHGWPAFNPERSNDPLSDRRQNSRDDNYGLGDINRFISVGTPFNGSSIGNYFEPLFCPELFKNDNFESMRVESREFAVWVKDIPKEAVQRFSTPYPNPHGVRTEYTGPTAVPDLMEGEISANFAASAARRAVEHHPTNWKFGFSYLDDFAKSPVCAWHPIATLVRSPTAEERIVMPLAFGYGPGAFKYLLATIKAREPLRLTNILQLTGRGNGDLVVPLLSALNADIDDPNVNTEQTGRCSVVRGAVDDPDSDVSHTDFAPYVGQPNSDLVFNRIKAVLRAPREQYRGAMELYK